MPDSLCTFRTTWLVDDDPEDIIFLEDAVLRIAPSQVIMKFFSGEQFLNALYEQELPDLVFLDINMPPIDGFQCLEAIGELPKPMKLAVIIYTCSPNERDILKAYELGASLYITKPSSYKEIMTTVNDVFEMDWTAPRDISNKHFVGGKYVPYKRWK